MRVILFGASGMIGRGVLRECLLDREVENVLSIGRAPLDQTDAKLSHVIVADVGDLSAIEAELAGCDACFFCLGVSSAGMSEAKYRQITHDIAVGAARTLARLNPSFRPGFIQPLHGITSRTAAYRVGYVVMKPLIPVLKALFPKQITTTESIGKAMLVAAKRGAPKPILESADINALAGAPS